MNDPKFVVESWGHSELDRGIPVRVTLLDISKSGVVPVRDMYHAGFNKKSAIDKKVKQLESEIIEDLKDRMRGMLDELITLTVAGNSD